MFSISRAVRDRSSSLVFTLGFGERFRMTLFCFFSLQYYKNKHKLLNLIRYCNFCKFVAKKHTYRVINASFKRPTKQLLCTFIFYFFLPPLLCSVDFTPIKHFIYQGRFVNISCSTHI